MNSNFHFEAKEKVILAGASKVFQSWHEQAGVSVDDFLAGVRWLCDDPMPDGRLSRELGCIRMADAGYTPEQRVILGDIRQHDGVGLHRLTRVYYSDGSFNGFRDENGERWDSTLERASINAMDRV